jgi:mRNA-degrading endonuclease RelE of RelBE toxin-antitoxin system
MPLNALRHSRVRAGSFLSSDDEEMREVIVGDYRIVYRLDSEVLIILTVFRSSRPLPLGLVDP